MMKSKENLESLIWIETYLAQVKTRTIDVSEETHINEKLSQFKQLSVAIDDQEQAKKIWCYETILHIQNQYLDAFQNMKEQYFYSAWCALASIESNLYFLERHFDLNTCGTDKFLLSFIKKHVERFQSLFPYGLFFSPGFVALEKVCTICNKPVAIRKSCGHEIGEIYNGEMCSRRITKVQFVEISYVSNPEQKYSVAFVVNPRTGQSEDHYNYCQVDYVINGLHNAFSGWEFIRTTVKHPNSKFYHIGRNALCPCKSGKKFKNCCLRKEFLELKHISIQFSEPPPYGYPSYMENKFIRGKGTPKRPLEGKDLMDKFNSLETDGK